MGVAAHLVARSRSRSQGCSLERSREVSTLVSRLPSCIVVLLERSERASLWRNMASERWPIVPASSPL